MPSEVPVLTVADAAGWQQWLAREASTSKGVWLTLAKKGVQNPTSLTYMQALEEALCYGWIDGQARKVDESTYSHRFTPRAVKSAWSQRNVKFVARLEEQGRMKAAGREAVRKAKLDGRWDMAYAGQAKAKTPSDLLAAIALDTEAQVKWDALTKQARFEIYLQLQNIKTAAGREKRIATFVDGLKPACSSQSLKQTVETKFDKRGRDVLPERRRTRSGRISKKG